MFVRRAVSTPFRNRDVNVYLAGRTLVDPGPDTDDAFGEVTDLLADHGLAPGDVRQVLVTHPHVDHFGGAYRFADAGAAVLASPDAATVVGDYAARIEAEESFLREFCRRCGMDDRTAEVVAGLRGRYLEYGGDVTVDRQLEAGDRLAVGTTDLEVLALAGHSPGEIGFGFENPDGSRAALVGDNVLANNLPVPFVYPPLSPGGERPRALPAYLDSLARLREGDFDRLYAGHHDPVETPNERIAAIEGTLERRIARVRDALDEPATPVEILNAVFANLSAAHRALAICKVVGYLDVLERRGRVRADDRGDRIVYERAPE